MTKRKIYNINGTGDFGIDLDKVLCFYLGCPESYGAINNTFLYILIGNQITQPQPLKLHYSECNFINKENLKIEKSVEQLYKDLIEYFKNE